VTETESEKKADLALADLIGVSGGMIASAVGTAATGVLSKSADESDLKFDSAPPDAATEMASARAAYYDAWVEVESHGDGSAAAANQLVLAKSRYNDLRRSLGLELLQ
jgi:hypothetical protein